MKKSFVMILFLTAALVLASCQGKPAAPEEAAAADTEAAAEETVPDEAVENPFAALFAETADFPTGTAGSSMQAALLQERFLSTVFVFGFTKPEEAEDMAREAYDALDTEQKDLFRENFGDIVDAGIRTALEDFSSVEGTFDDAGVKESMQTLLEAPEIAESWDSFSGAVSALFE